ncbi:toxin RelE [bacterium BMS3Bbin09]|nr:toxin RelE [bacterium BMS3Bbin09]HDH34465.1 type II toxin-antitoxin system mRNA interferase toxin, RelE/StbE family [Nitrospirota bacterium]
MSYKDRYHPGIKADLKKLDKQVIKDIFRLHIDKILQEPDRGDRLHGDLEGLFSYHFRKRSVDYRIAYTIEEGKKLVFFLRIGKRESFYEVLRRRLS